MFKSCSICGAVYQWKKSGKHDRFMPPVCSTECFKKLIRPAKCNLPAPGKISAGFYCFEFKSEGTRSSYEDRFALWAENNRITALHEVRKFELPSGHRYVPDYFIANRYGGVWVEIKGLWLNSGFSKFREFADIMPRPVYLIDLPFLTLLERS